MILQWDQYHDRLQLCSRRMIGVLLHCLGFRSPIGYSLLEYVPCGDKHFAGYGHLYLHTVLLAFRAKPAEELVVEGTLGTGCTPGAFSRCLAEEFVSMCYAS